VFFDPDNPAAGFFWYRGGSTIVVNPRGRAGAPEIKYVIGKPIYNAERMAAELAFRTNPPTSGGGNRAMYFGNHGMAAREPFAALHNAED